MYSFSQFIHYLYLSSVICSQQSQVPDQNIIFSPSNVNWSKILMEFMRNPISQAFEKNHWELEKKAHQNQNPGSSKKQ